MKKVLMIIGAFSLVAMMMSYSATDGGAYSHHLVIPLKQRGVRVTSDYSVMSTLIKKGWVVTDVDIADDNHSDDRKYYTLILY